MLYFVRVGSTDWSENKNKKGELDPKCQGRVNLSLNNTGLLQAEKCADALKNKKFDRVISSPLKRAMQTCEIINDGTINVEYDERITERDFGEFEGLTKSEYNVNEFWNIYSNQKFKRAETLRDVVKRVFSLLDELSENKNKNYLIVSHRGIGCVISSYFKGIPSDGNYLTYEIPNGKQLVFDFNKITLSGD